MRKKMKMMMKLMKNHLMKKKLNKKEKNILVKNINFLYNKQMKFNNYFFK